MPKDTTKHDDNLWFLQKTIAQPVRCRGVGLHSGEQIDMTLRPAEVNTGVVFRRMDVAGQDVNPNISARYDQVGVTRLCTTIENADGVQIATIEHLMAALAGCGIDNVIVELSGAEVPIMDGSAITFVFLIECAGVKAQSASRSFIKVLKPVEVELGNSRLTLHPSDTFSATCTIDFAADAIQQQGMTYTLTPASFKAELARARTFGMLQDVEMLQAAGLALGGSLENAIVVDGDQVLNPEGLRYGDEFIRHKILDVLGDLYLAGAPLLAHVEAHKPSHALNNLALRQLMADEAAWCYTTPAMAAVTVSQPLSKSVAKKPGYGESNSYQPLALAAQPA